MKRFIKEGIEHASPGAALNLIVDELCGEYIRLSHSNWNNIDRQKCKLYVMQNFDRGAKKFCRNSNIKDCDYYSFSNKDIEAEIDRALESI